MQKQVVIQKINARVRESGINSATSIAGATAQVQHAHVLVIREWNRCCQQLERTEFRGALLSHATTGATC